VNRILIPIAAAALLSGCAAPPEATRQTKLTISVLTEYQEAAQTFSTEHARSVNYLAGLAAERRRNLEASAQFAKDELALMQAVGDPGALEVHSRITTLMSTLAENKAARHTLEQLQVETAALLKPLPYTAAATDETKKALGKLLDGVPKDERFKELQSYYDIAQKSLKDAKAKLAEPPAAASAAGQ
jgi:hypothetical protein